MDGDALLFVGAGLSFLATSETGSRVPDAGHLGDLLLGQPLGTGSKHRLDRISGAVARKEGVDFVFDVIKKNFTVTSVDDRLRTLYGLPWKRIYTTNYDNAIEVSRSGVRPISTITLDDSPATAVSGSIIHLNGYVKRVSPANINASLLLTDASYASSRLISTGWLSEFERDIKLSRSVFFVGYSLYDLDIDSVLLTTEGIGGKAFFFISPDADEIEVSTLERYGTVISGGVDAIVRLVQQESASYVAPRFVGGLTAVREVAPPDIEDKGTVAQKIFKQLVYGIVPEAAVLRQEVAFDGQGYLVLREQDQAARQAIREGPWRDVLFVGEMCSGKSASTLNLAVFLRSQGYSVYFAEKRESLSSDLRRLCEVNDKIALIFDGYSQFRDEIADYVARRPLEHRLILSERSAIHELVEGFLERTPHLGPLREIALDRIAGDDLPKFEALTNFGGFWGDRSGLSPSSRQRFIRESLDSSLYRLLLEIMKSEKVRAEIRALLSPLSHNEKASRIFCSALIVNSLGFEFTISEWQYLFDRSAIRSMLKNYDEQIRHFFFNDYNHIYARNGVLSSHLLHEFMDDDLVRSSLVGLYERAERSSAEDRTWDQLRIELMKFSAIEPMFSDKNRSQEILQYYDEIRVFGTTASNADYWLQTGIAATIFSELALGEMCFKNAYARERAKRSPNLTKIDNYAARFDMSRAVAEGNPDASFSLFISANDRLVRQIFLDNNRHYPFKTGRYFADVAAKHYDNWSDKQKASFLEATSKIREKAREWKRTKREHSADVELLIKETSKLLSRLKPASED